MARTSFSMALCLSCTISSLLTFYAQQLFVSTISKPSNFEGEKSISSFLVLDKERLFIFC